MCVKGKPPAIKVHEKAEQSSLFLAIFWYLSGSQIQVGFEQGNFSRAFKTSCYNSTVACPNGGQQSSGVGFL